MNPSHMTRGPSGRFTMSKDLTSIDLRRSVRFGDCSSCLLHTNSSDLWSRRYHDLARLATGHHCPRPIRRPCPRARTWRPREAGRILRQSPFHASLAEAMSQMVDIGPHARPFLSTARGNGNTVSRARPTEGGAAMARGMNNTRDLNVPKR